MAMRFKLTLVVLLSLGVGMWGVKSLLPSPFLWATASQPLPSLSVGVVDINSIKADSKVFQKFKKNLDDLNASIHKEILAQETALRAEYEAFKKQEEDAGGATRAILELKAQLDKKHAELEEMVRTRREELDQQYTNGLSQIKQNLKEILATLGKKHNLKIILNKSIGDGSHMDQSIILFCHEEIDLTREAIQNLDAQSSDGE